MLGWLKKRAREPGWLAICFEGPAIRYAQLRRVEGGKPVAARWGVVTGTGDEARDGLARTIKEAALSSSDCMVVLVPGEYHIMAVDAPSVAREELKSAIRWKIKDLLEYHVDDATVDVLEIPGDPAPDGKPRLMYSVATQNELVKKRISDCDHAHLSLKVIDIPEMAQRNIATRFEVAGRTTALVSFREWGGLLTFSQSGELQLTRRLEVSSEQLAQPEHRSHYIERVGSELQRSFENFERRFHRSPINELLVAPLLEGQALTQYLAANLYVPVRQIELSELFDFAGDRLPGADEQDKYFHLFGAALREESRGL